MSEPSRAGVAGLIAQGRDREAARRGADGVTSDTPDQLPAGSSRIEELAAFTGREDPGGLMTATLSPSDLGELKTKQQATWASGNYAVIGTTLQIMGESLCEAVDIAAGSKVLDVAAGNGNASLAAARRGADVTTTDYVDTLLGLAQRRAEADGLRITTQVA